MGAKVSLNQSTKGRELRNSAIRSLRPMVAKSLRGHVIQFSDSRLGQPLDP
ncbi:hypothetical protein M8756_16185 [Lutimaribacter sp. EGI FJ00015]|nr:hypothetical protein [Lutimaribacter sp. EGI FJ00015]